MSFNLAVGCHFGKRAVKRFVAESQFAGEVLERSGEQATVRPSAPTLTVR